MLMMKDQLFHGRQTVLQRPTSGELIWERPVWNLFLLLMRISPFTSLFIIYTANDSAFLVGPLRFSPAFAQLDGAFTENRDAVFWRLKIRFIIYIILQEANGSNELMDELSLKYWQCDASLPILRSLIKFFELYIAMVTLCMTPHSSWLTDGLTDLGHSPDTFCFQSHPRSHVLVGVLKWVTSGCFVPVCQLSEPTAKNCFWSPQHKKKINPEINMTLLKPGAVKLTPISLNCAWQRLSLSFIACVLVPRSCYKQVMHKKGSGLMLGIDPSAFAVPATLH